MLMPLGPAYASEITFTLFVGFLDLGLTAGGSTRRGKPFPLPLTVLSTQSPTGTAGPVYGKRVSTSRFSKSAGAACVVTIRAPRSADAVFVLMPGDKERKKDRYRGLARSSD